MTRPLYDLSRLVQVPFVSGKASSIFRRIRDHDIAKVFILCGQSLEKIFKSFHELLDLVVQTRVGELADGIQNVSSVYDHSSLPVCMCVSAASVAWYFLTTVFTTLLLLMHHLQRAYCTFLKPLAGTMTSS